MINYIVDQSNDDLRKMIVNMVPFSRLHFFISTFAPIFSHNFFEYNRLTLSQLIQQIFDKKNLMIDCNPQHGRYLGMMKIFRGEISIKEIDKHMFDLQTKDSFDSKNFKTTLCRIPSRELPISATLIGKIHFPINPNECRRFF
jgi:tubulin beta